MNEQIASIIRSVLKVAGGALVTKGVTDSATLEMAIGGLVALTGIVWSWLHHAAPVTTTP